MPNPYARCLLLGSCLRALSANTLGMQQHHVSKQHARPQAAGKRATAGTGLLTSLNRCKSAACHMHLSQMLPTVPLRGADSRGKPLCKPTHGSMNSQLCLGADFLPPLRSSQLCLGAVLSPSGRLPPLPATPCIKQPAGTPCDQVSSNDTAPNA